MFNFLKNQNSIVAVSIDTPLRLRRAGVWSALFHHPTILCSPFSFLCATPYVGTQCWYPFVIFTSTRAAPHFTLVCSILLIFCDFTSVWQMFVIASFHYLGTVCCYVVSPFHSVFPQIIFVVSAIRQHP